MADDAGTLSVELVHGAATGVVEVRTLRLAPGSRVVDALVAGGCAAAIDAQGGLRGGLRVGVWGRPRRLDHVLADGDRVELCRPLHVDPMEARRLRHQRLQRDRRAPKGPATR